MQITLLLCCALLALAAGSSFEDNDFAEFEDFDSDDEFIEVPVGGGSPSSQDIPVVVTKEKDTVKVQIPSDDEEDGIVEDEDEFFKDDEEFEGFDGGDVKEETRDKKAPEPKLTVAKIPMHFR